MPSLTVLKMECTISNNDHKYNINNNNDNNNNDNSNTNNNDNNNTNKYIRKQLLSSITKRVISNTNEKQRLELHKYSNTNNNNDTNFNNNSENNYNSGNNICNIKNKVNKNGNNNNNNNNTNNNNDNDSKSNGNNNSNNNKNIENNNSTNNHDDNNHGGKGTMTSRANALSILTKGRLDESTIEATLLLGENFDKSIDNYNIDPSEIVSEADSFHDGISSYRGVVESITSGVSNFIPTTRTTTATMPQITAPFDQYRLQLYNYALHFERLRCPSHASVAAVMAAAATATYTNNSTNVCNNKSSYSRSCSNKSNAVGLIDSGLATNGIYAAALAATATPSTGQYLPANNRLSLSLFPHRIFLPEQPKPQHSYIGLIAMAILSSVESKLVLSDIYQYILDNYPYFRTRGPGWRNSIRHNLSLNDCFIKSGRSANGKGHYWAIHPANLEDFRKGDFRRRKAQRKVRKHLGLSVDDAGPDSPSPPPLDLSSTPPSLVPKTQSAEGLRYPVPVTTLPMHIARQQLTAFSYFQQHQQQQQQMHHFHMHHYHQYNHDYQPNTHSYPQQLLQQPLHTITAASTPAAAYEQQQHYFSYQEEDSDALTYIPQNPVTLDTINQQQQLQEQQNQEQNRLQLVVEHPPQQYAPYNNNSNNVNESNNSRNHPTITLINKTMNRTETSAAASVLANYYSKTTRKRQFDVASLLAPDVKVDIADGNKATIENRNELSSVMTTQHTLIAKVSVQHKHHHHHHHHIKNHIHGKFFPSYQHQYHHIQQYQHLPKQQHQKTNNVALNMDQEEQEDIDVVASDAEDVKNDYTEGDYDEDYEVYNADVNYHNDDDEYDYNGDGVTGNDNEDKVMENNDLLDNSNDSY